MKYEMLGMCPVCGGETKITKVRCEKCNTEISGRFEPCKFCKLSMQQKLFVEVFIKNRGNIKEIEKELRISYPTVRNKLEEVISALGYIPDNKVSAAKRDILDKLSRGEITREQAFKMINDY